MRGEIILTRKRETCEGEAGVRSVHVHHQASSERTAPGARLVLDQLEYEERLGSRAPLFLSSLFGVVIGRAIDTALPQNQSPRLSTAGNDKEQHPVRSTAGIFPHRCIFVCKPSKQK
jgi:hypothetical protein